MFVGVNQHPQEVQVGKEPTSRIATLEPLRTEGQAALEITGFERVLLARLREIELAYASTFQRITVIRADDLFGLIGPGLDHSAVIPEIGRITRAILALQFADSTPPIYLELCVPMVPTLPPDNRAGVVNRWLARSRFVNDTTND